MYRGVEFCISEYYQSGSYWHRYDYTSTFEGGCMQTATYTDNDGNTRTDGPQKTCSSHTTVLLKDPTCTQDGSACNECIVCGARDEAYSLSALDHSFEQAEGDTYQCSRCGLESANGASGSIIMEDLCAQYGNGESYVVGYAMRTQVEFLKNVSLVVGEDGLVILEGVEFTEIDGLRAVVFSRAQVEELAIAAGYTDSSTYSVRFTFVPLGADSSFDYSIIFTDAPVGE